MNLKNKNILVVGLGSTGLAVTRFLTKAQATVVATDIADEMALGNQVQQIKRLGVKTEFGKHASDTFERADLIVISPGVPHMIEPVIRAQKRGIPVIGEVELASRFIREPMVAITGTNGKTTTTELIGAMLQSSGRKVFVGGTIGPPLIGYVETGQAADIVVAEISSFQLDTIKHFRPKVSVVLNISPDHLDRYADLEAYANSKMRIVENQRGNDIAVLNGADPEVYSRSRHLKCHKLVYPNPQANENGAALEDGCIILKLKDAKYLDSKIRNPKSTRLPSTGYIRPEPFGRELRVEIRNRQSVDTAPAALWGRHNLENACAAALAALAGGATVEGIQNALNQFQGAAHRLEYIASINSVQYYNDSKATNVEAVKRALQCFSKPVILIMGGRDKGSDFKALGAAVGEHVKTLIVMGEAASAIRFALAQIIPAIFASSMQDAVKKAFEASEPGEIVLLSPACASFDMYDSYAQRGDDFRQSVEKIKRNHTA